MLSILAQSFRVATHTDERDKPKRQKWLPEDHWWIKDKRATQDRSA